MSYGLEDALCEWSGLIGPSNIGEDDVDGIWKDIAILELYIMTFVILRFLGPFPFLI